MLLKLIPALALIAAARAYLHDGSSNSNFTLPLSLQMADAIISRRQGILTSTNDRSNLLQAGFVQKTFSQLAEQYPNHPRLTGYTRASVNSVNATISNATQDTSFPLDRLSSGNGLIKAYQETRNATYKATYEALLTSVRLQPKNVDGSLWYYVYPNYTYLDGMYSLAPFLTLYATSNNTTNTGTIDFVIRQLNLTYQHTLQPSALLVHGYDASMRASWANQTTGASSIVWGRSLGWYCMALIDTLELLPKHATKAKTWLSSHLKAVIHAVVEAADADTGAWYQVIDQPEREGNYIESSASSMFVYTLLKGIRLGVLDDKRYVDVARRAYSYIEDTFVVPIGNGTLSWNGTVGVCSLNSTATYKYYVTQPLVYNSVLGAAAFVLASAEVERCVNGGSGGESCSIRL